MNRSSTQYNIHPPEICIGLSASGQESRFKKRHLPSRSTIPIRSIVILPTVSHYHSRFIRGGNLQTVANIHDRMRAGSNRFWDSLSTWGVKLGFHDISGRADCPTYKTDTVVENQASIYITSAICGKRPVWSITKRKGTGTREIASENAGDQGWKAQEDQRYIMSLEQHAATGQFTAWVDWERNEAWSGMMEGNSNGQGDSHDIDNEASIYMHAIDHWALAQVEEQSKTQSKTGLGVWGQTEMAAKTNVLAE